MAKYILKRILFFIPTLIVISLLAFIISINAPGDPVELLVNATGSSEGASAQSANVQDQKQYWREKLGLNLPVFYVNLSNIATPDTLYKIYDLDNKNALQRLISEYGNWPYISEYYKSVQQLYTMHTGFKTDSNSESAITKNELAAAYNNSKHTTLALLSTYNETVINAHLSELKNYYKHNIIFPGFAEKLHRVEENFNRVKQNASMWKYFIPAVHLYGDNQYHRWVFGDGNWLTGRGSKYSKGIVRGDFGTSYTTRLPVIDVIRYRIGWSVFFTLVSVIIAYIVSIPIGIKSAKKKGSNFDRFSTVILFILYSLPSFWIATLLLMTFANPDNFALFPASGIGPATGIPENTGFFEAIKLRLPYLVLPTIAYTYSSFAFLSRIMRVSMLEIISQDYIRTARAKGLSEDAVIYKHAFRNALLPIITIFANIFPHAIGGSVILEYIFTIPGMGLETFIALQQQNYPMIVAVFTITGILTLTGFLISDILYALADPRISFSNH